MGQQGQVVIVVWIGHVFTCVGFQKGAIIGVRASDLGCLVDSLKARGFGFSDEAIVGPPAWLRQKASLLAARQQGDVLAWFGRARLGWNADQTEQVAFEGSELAA